MRIIVRPSRVVRHALLSDVAVMAAADVARRLGTFPSFASTPSLRLLYMWLRRMRKTEIVHAVPALRCLRFEKRKQTLYPNPPSYAHAPHRLPFALNALLNLGVGSEKLSHVVSLAVVRSQMRQAQDRALCVSSCLTS